MSGAKAVASAFPEYPVTLLRVRHSLLIRTNDFHRLTHQVKRGSHLKNYVSMIGADTMAIGGSEVARDLLRVSNNVSA